MELFSELFHLIAVFVFSFIGAALGAWGMMVWQRNRK
jgi:hypothetical protein